MKSKPFCYGLRAAALVLALGSAATLAHADLYVVESTAAAVKVGSQLSPSDALNIPAGAHIRAVLPSGKTQTIKGPYQGTVADLEKGQIRNDGMMTWVRNILQTGGSNEATPGATRSISPPAPNARAGAGFSWTTVPVATEGSVCVEKGARLQLVRSPTHQPSRATVVDVANAVQGEVQWDAGNDAAAWPANVTVRPDGVYALLVQDRPRRQVTLRVVEKPAESDVLVELYRLGCRQQFEAWMRERLAAK